MLLILGTYRLIISIQRLRNKMTPQRTKESTHAEHSVSEVDLHVGLRLRLLRLDKGWSQTRVAEQIGISYQQLQKYESGMNRIGAGRLWELCQIYTVQPNTLFEGLSTEHDVSSLTRSSIAASVDLLAARQNHRLLTYFAKINDPTARSAIVTLCESLTDKPAS